MTLFREQKRLRSRFQLEHVADAPLWRSEVPLSGGRTNAQESGHEILSMNRLARMSAAVLFLPTAPANRSRQPPIAPAPANRQAGRKSPRPNAALEPCGPTPGYAQVT